MEDKIVTLGKGTIIQHGKKNNRIYLIKLDPEDQIHEVLEALGELAHKERYTKIFCKVPNWAAPHFIAEGYLNEAFIPNFYKGKTGAFFLSKFLSSDRLLGLETDQLNLLGEMLESQQRVKKRSQIDPSIRKLGMEDANSITQIFKEVFLSYPFPIHDPNYILKTMEENVTYYGIEQKGELVAVASAEMDHKGGNAEMTDFATLPKFRGQGLALQLLSKMEQEMQQKNISTLYTIARLNSPAMNKTFINLNYTYAGTLVMNTNIAGKIESMNVFYKTLITT